MLLCGKVSMVLPILVFQSIIVHNLSYVFLVL